MLPSMGFCFFHMWHVYPSIVPDRRVRVSRFTGRLFHRGPSRLPLISYGLFRYGVNLFRLPWVRRSPCLRRASVRLRQFPMVGIVRPDGPLFQRVLCPSAFLCANVSTRLSCRHLFALQMLPRRACVNHVVDGSPLRQSTVRRSRQRANGARRGRRLYRREEEVFRRVPGRGDRGHCQRVSGGTSPVMGHGESLFRELIEQRRRTLSAYPHSTRALRARFPFLTGRHPVRGARESGAVTKRRPRGRVTSFVRGGLRGGDSRHAGSTPNGCPRRLGHLCLNRLLRRFVPYRVHGQRSANARRGGTSRASSTRGRGRLRDALRNGSLASVVV